MNEQELDALVESRLATALAARQAGEREAMRMQVVLELRRAAEREHHAKINSRHAIQDPLAGLTPEQEMERVRQMDERRRISNARMDAANARPVDGQVVRGMRPKRSDSAGGSVGFTIK
jgi:hypothetical protein